MLEAAVTSRAQPGNRTRVHASTLGPLSVCAVRTPPVGGLLAR